jgi:hypothetical protein
MHAPLPSRPGRRARALVAAGVAACAATGCASDGSGALEQSSVAVDCRPGDADCAELGLDRAIAVGASVTLDVAVASPGSSTPPLVLVPVDAEVLAAEGARVTAAAPGMTALLFVAEGSGDVVDFVHVFAEAADALAVSSRGALGGGARPVEGPIQLLAGEDVVLAASPARGGSTLGGEVEATWSARQAPEDDGAEGPVVTLLETGFAAERRLVARAPGTATVTVEALGLAAEVTVEVLP